MIQVQYNNAAFTLRFEFPHDWNVQSITDVTLGIKDTGGTELLAAASTTLGVPDPIRLNGAVSEDDNTITLEPTDPLDSVPALTTGDHLQIAADASGPHENVEVLFYNSTLKVATLKRNLRYDHGDEAAVVGLWSTYDLDTSDTDVFTLGEQMVFTWDPDTDDLPIKEQAEIVIAEFTVPGFEERFAALYTGEYDAAMNPDNRLARFLKEAHDQLATELLVRGLLLDRVIDQALLVPSLMNKVRWLILLTGDDRYDTERRVCLEEYQRQFELLSTAPIWGDDNQDEVLDSDEYEDHSWSMGLERSM
jgi:hypothetical protein